MSDYTIQMEAQSPARSPEPLHQRPLPERPFALPISPQSALVALSLADGDKEALKSLSQSLITTIQKHTKEVRQTNDAKDACIRELEHLPFPVTTNSPLFLPRQKSSVEVRTRLVDYPTPQKSYSLKRETCTSSQHNKKRTYSHGAYPAPAANPKPNPNLTT